MVCALSVKYISINLFVLPFLIKQYHFIRNVLLCYLKIKITVIYNLSVLCKENIFNKAFFTVLVQACLRAPHVVADEAKLAIVFTYFFCHNPTQLNPELG